MDDRQLEKALRSRSVQLPVRILLSGIVLWFVYQETGWATTTALACLTLGIEVGVVRLMYLAGIVGQIARLVKLEPPKD